jgi:hypothetical protein
MERIHGHQKFTFLVESQILSLGSHKYSHIPTDDVSAFFHSLATCGTTSGDNIHNAIFLSLEEYFVGTKHPTMSYGEDAWTPEFTFLAKSHTLSLGAHKSFHIPTDGVSSALFHSLAISGTTIYIHNVTFILSLEE